MSFSVEQILTWTGGQLSNGADLGPSVDAIRVERPSVLALSRSSDVGFFFNRAYEKELATADPGVLITSEAFVKPLRESGLPLWKKTAVLSCPDPYLAMAILSEKFASIHSTVAHVSEPGETTDIHPTAIVDPSAQIGHGVRIGAHCVVEWGAKIGDGTVLYPGCFVGPEVVIGAKCVLFPGVAVYEWSVIGDRVRLHAGVVIGSDGFGYAPKREGKKVVGHQKLFHLGRVVIGDDVEIGANSCVDRATFGETVIGNNSKLDNLVHIGHNSRLDEGAVICGGTCLAGRASIGKYAYVGGLTGVGNDVHVGDGASVGALAMVTKDVPPGGTAVGNPQRDYREHFRAHAYLNRLIAEKKSESGKREK